MIGTEFFYGQGLGNQLFCYVVSRCIALDRHAEFGTVGQEFFGDRRYNQKGPYFMELDLGRSVCREDFQRTYEEKSSRLFLNTCEHDCLNGCDVRLYDPEMAAAEDGTLLLGVMQAEDYFSRHREEIRQWLKVKPEFDSYRFSQDDLCVINMRGGEYVGLKELYLGREYWLKAMEYMRALNPDMRFVVITEDVKAAKTILPEVEAYHFDLAGDYTAVKNARYLILSNSSFAFFPAFTSETVKRIIAPKYWARYNVSDGYWSTGQNIYSGWEYLGRDGMLYSADECRREFQNYIIQTRLYERTDHPLWYRRLFLLMRRVKSGVRKCFGILGGKNVSKTLRKL